MYRKILVLFVPALCFLLAATSLYLGRDHLTRLSNLYLPLPLQHATEPTTTISLSTSLSFSTPTSVSQISTSTSTFSSSSSSAPTSTASSSAKASVKQTSTTVTSADASASPTAAETSTIPILNGTILSTERISPYIKAILDPASKDRPRLECPALDTKRYKSLQKTRNKRDSHERQQEIDFFFALNLRNVVDLLPRLLGSVVEAVRFLGPERCALSIVEGNSPDGTADVLAALKPFFDDIGLVYFYNTSDINPKKGPRIRKLAQLRNLALKPLYKKKVPVSDDTTVLFINDVAACTEDLLELALQRRNLNADMTCAMDWTYVADAPSFYDVWVARALNGDLFFNVTQDGQWDHAWNLFWNEPVAKARFDAHLPFQVFACWNGATAFTAAPLLHGLRFRDSKKDECFQGEPQLFCKDMWFRGYRKIAAIPSISLEYSDGNGQQLKQLKGYTSEVVNKQNFDKNRIEWQYEPPEKVKCMPSFNNQYWLPWNETLA
ncbi:hypothetical protein FDECE_7792 [Fusarium decemcellulare]|nr:hypothetical protein FDECE_7792 [Fusarium decemcellulare]